MRKRSVNLSAPYQSIVNTSTITGLSQHFIRQGIKDGTIPFIRSGTMYFVNVAGLLNKLDAESRGVGA